MCTWYSNWITNRLLTLLTILAIRIL